MKGKGNVKFYMAKAMENAFAQSQSPCKKKKKEFCYPAKRTAFFWWKNSMFPTLTWAQTLPKATDQPRGLGERLPPAALACFAKHTFSQKSSPSVLLTPRLRHTEQWLLCCSLWVTEPRLALCGSMPGQALTNRIFKNRKIPADSLNIWFDIFSGISELQEVDYFPWTGFPPYFQHSPSSPSSLWLCVCEQ